MYCLFKFVRFVVKYFMNWNQYLQWRFNIISGLGDKDNSSTKTAI